MAAVLNGDAQKWRKTFDFDFFLPVKRYLFNNSNDAGGDWAG